MHEESAHQARVEAYDVELGDTRHLLESFFDAVLDLRERHDAVRHVVLSGERLVASESKVRRAVVVVRECAVFRRVHVEVLLDEVCEQVRVVHVHLALDRLDHLPHLSVFFHFSGLRVRLPSFDSPEYARAVVVLDGFSVFVDDVRHVIRVLVGIAVRVFVICHTSRRAVDERDDVTTRWTVENFLHVIPHWRLQVRVRVVPKQIRPSLRLCKAETNLPKHESQHQKHRQFHRHHDVL